MSSCVSLCSYSFPDPKLHLQGLQARKYLTMYASPFSYQHVTYWHLPPCLLVDRQILKTHAQHMWCQVLEFDRHRFRNWTSLKFRNWTAWLGLRSHNITWFHRLKKEMFYYVRIRFRFENCSERSLVFGTRFAFLLSVVSYSLNQFWADVSYCPLLVQLEPPGNFLYLIYICVYSKTACWCQWRCGYGWDFARRQSAWSAKSPLVESTTFNIKTI